MDPGVSGWVSRMGAPEGREKSRGNLPRTVDTTGAWPYSWGVGNRGEIEMMTTDRVGFTKGQDGRIAPCYGAHHKDVAVLGHCDGCGMEVAKSDDGRIMTVYYRGDWSARKVACWAPNHECDPEHAAAYQAKIAAEIEAGEIIKGQTVEVVRGRKVPRGTVGEIVWVGEDSFGKARVGIKTAEGETVFTAQANVEVQS